MLRVAPARIRVALEAPALGLHAERVARRRRRGRAPKVGLPPASRWFIYVGGFSPHKNVDLIVKAHASVARACAPAPHLVLVGALTGDVFHGDQERIRTRSSQGRYWRAGALDGIRARRGIAASALRRRGAVAAVDVRRVRPARGRGGGVRHAGHRDDRQSAAGAAGRAAASSSRRATKPRSRLRYFELIVERAGQARHGRTRARAGCRVELDAVVRAPRLAHCRRRRHDEPLRFCFLTTFYPPYSFGGDGIGIQRLARALAGRGHHVTVVHDVDAYDVLRRDPARPLAEPPEPPGLDVVRLRSGARAAVAPADPADRPADRQWPEDSSDSRRGPVRRREFQQHLAGRRAGTARPTALMRSASISPTSIGSCAPRTSFGVTTASSAPAASASGAR